MRTPPEYRRAHPRAGRNYEEDLNLRYIAPGAFTILPPEDNVPPEPPSAPAPYRLTPSTRRHRNQSFAIIGEPTSSNPGSRSSSPSGRVSPFKGRGFNPAGSRFASPNPSPPPPEDARLTPTKVSPRHTSKIPQYSRRGSATAFGEKVDHYEPSFSKKDQQQQSGRRGNLNSNQLSQSLNSLESKNAVSNKRPPISPRKKPNSKAPAFQRLSPIVGSSPEPSQSQSSPSRIPTKSRSTPPSRFTSPTRQDYEKRSVSRGQSRSQLKKSRDTSPSDNSSSSPTKGSVAKKNYKHVQAKVNSFNKPKPKVPPKPQFLSEQSEESDVSPPAIANNKPTLSRNNSVTKRTNSKSNILQKTINNNQVNNNNQCDSSSTEASNKNANSKNVSSNNNSEMNKNNANNNNKSNSNNTKNQTPRKSDSNSTNNKTNSTRISREDLTTLPKTQVEKIKKEHANAIDSSSDETDKHGDTLPSAVVSSTTSTVTKPLHIEAKLPPTGYDRPKPVSPLVDGRILSATSVSRALNKMNDTVMNTQTVIKEHGFSKLSPAANAVIAVAKEGKERSSGVATKSETSDTPKSMKVAPSVVASTTTTTSDSDRKTTAVANNKVDSIVSSNRVNSNVSGIHENPTSGAVVNNNHTGVQGNHTNHTGSNNLTSNNNNNVSNNHVSHIGIGTSKAIELEVQRNMDKLISADGKIIENSLNSVKKSANDRLKEARTIIAADVQPIKITVREKPSDVEVQSGNIRVPGNVANGINEIRPGLPQNNHQQSPPNNEPKKEDTPKNACSRFFASCKNKLICECCKKCRKTQTEQQHFDEEKGRGCFQCLKRKQKEQPRVTINVENETGKKKFWDKMKCCNRNKIRDTSSCFPMGRRKESWMDSRETMLSNAERGSRCCSKLCCKNFFRKMFCLNLCCKKKEPELPASRKASIISSNKKKSLTPGTTLPPPPEDTRPKIDQSLVEHTSHMRGAIPVLPVSLAWLCLVLNCVFPGTGTTLSGLFCLCIGKPRFSQKDGAKQRIGAFIIDLIIGFSQFFTVLFCLVGWGWSIWWGVIMIKVAKKHNKIKHLEALEETASRPIPVGQHNNRTRDPEHGL